MKSESPRVRKQELRAALRPRSERSADPHICRRLLLLPELQQASTVALYAARPDEVDLSVVFDALVAKGVQTVFPRVEREKLVLCGVSELAELRPGSWEILEPPLGAEDLEPEEVDVFLVPGLLFDRKGRRLGRGGGHYDRLLQLSRANALRVGVSYASRLFEELPAQGWDVNMHVVVSEDETYRCGGATP